MLVSFGGREHPAYATAQAAFCAVLAPRFVRYSHFRRHRHFHLADAVDAPLEPVPRSEPGNARRRARGDQRAGGEGGHGREEADVLAQRADHVAGMRAHHGRAVLLDADREVLRVVDLVARDDPRPEAGEGVESLADVPRVVPPLAPGIALAEVPQDGVAEDV